MDDIDFSVVEVWSAVSKPSNWPLPKDGVRFIVPQALVTTMMHNPLCCDLYPTAFGYYPQARGHTAERTVHDDNLLIYCVRGRAALTVENRERTVHGGQVVVLRQGLAHRYGADDEDPWTIYWVHFAGSRASDYLRRNDGAPLDVVTNVGILTKVMTDFAELLDARHSTYPHAAFVHAANNLKQLICYLAMPRPEAAEADMVDRANALMLERLAFGITLDELAEAVHLSKHHFVRRYRALTGTTPLARFNQLRIHRACQLLDGTPHPVSSIADQLGFDDPYYFSRLFRRVVGLSPSQYRRVRRG